MNEEPDRRRSVEERNFIMDQFRESWLPSHNTLTAMIVLKWAGFGAGFALALAALQS